MVLEEFYFISLEQDSCVPKKWFDCRNTIGWSGRNTQNQHGEAKQHCISTNITRKKLRLVTYNVKTCQESPHVMNMDVRCDVEEDK